MAVRFSRLSRALLGAALVVTVLVLAGCGSDTLNPIAPAGRTTTDWTIKGTPALHNAVEAQEQSSPMLLGLKGVIGTSAGLDAAGKGVVRVMVERPDVNGLPARVNGLRVVKVVTGRYRAWSLTGTFRPIHVGVATGNENECLPGTIGCIVEKNGTKYVLSANHVLARQNQAEIGETIIQPSLPDVDPDHCALAPASAEIAHLSEFQRVFYDGKTPNFMDAAIAEIDLKDKDISCATPAGFYGTPSSNPLTASLGIKVQKVGRTSGLTHGLITGVNTKVKIDFPSGTALMVGQLETSRQFGEFGDSGSLVVTDDSQVRPVGMVIGGDAHGSAVVTPIDRILSRFEVEVCSGDGRH